MRQRSLGGIVRAQRQTEKAFLCTFDWTEDHGYLGKDVWVPLSVIHEDSHDEIADAHDGKLIEIHIAEWWLRQL